MCLKKVDSSINCLTADDGVEAIAMLSTDAAYTPNYIFIDVNMPKMNGIDCLKMIKHIDRLKYTKIFMYSTTSEAAVLDETKNLGADDFIIKPAKTAELKEKLSTIFGIVSKIKK
jgi:CheY-like chemotaxis protein